MTIIIKNRLQMYFGIKKDLQMHRAFVIEAYSIFCMYHSRPQKKCSPGIILGAKIYF